MGIICAAISVCLWLVVAAVVISWFPLQSGTTLAGVARCLQIVTDPVLGPLRRVIPTVHVAGLALDLSPLVVILGLMALQWVVCP